MQLWLCFVIKRFIQQKYQRSISHSNSNLHSRWWGQEKQETKESSQKSEYTATIKVYSFRSRRINIAISIWRFKQSPNPSKTSQYKACISDTMHLNAGPRPPHNNRRQYTPTFYSSFAHIKFFQRKSVNALSFIVAWLSGFSIKVHQIKSSINQNTGVSPETASTCVQCH